MSDEQAPETWSFRKAGDINIGSPELVYTNCSAIHITPEPDKSVAEQLNELMARPEMKGMMLVPHLVPLLNGVIAFYTSKLSDEEQQDFEQYGKDLDEYMRAKRAEREKAKREAEKAKRAAEEEDKRLLAVGRKFEQTFKPIIDKLRAAKKSKPAQIVAALDEAGVLDEGDNAD